MFTQAELIDAIEQIHQGRNSIQNCEKLAAIYTVLDHMYGERKAMIEVSHDNRIESEVGLYGNTPFLKAISGKPAKDAWLLMDELIEAVTVFNPRLMTDFYDKLRAL